MRLSAFTRQVKECRRKWNRRTLQYILAVARIVRAARESVGNYRRWSRWIRESLRMNRSTIHRYLHIEAMVALNVASKQHFDFLSVAKLYALSRIKPERAAQLLKNSRAIRMPDREFLAMLRQWIPRNGRRPSPRNLMNAMTAAIGRIEQSMKKWHDNSLVMTPSDLSRIRSRLQAAEKTLYRISRSAAAM